MSNDTKIIEAIIEECLNHVVVTKLDEGNMYKWREAEEQDYADARRDLCAHLLALYGGVDLVNRTFDHGLQLAAALIEEHPDWVDPNEAELEEGDPFLELGEEKIAAAVYSVLHA